MNINQAIKFTDAHEKAAKTRLPSIKLVRALWSNFHLSETDIIFLAQQELANKYSAFKTGGSVLASQPAYNPPPLRSSSQSEREPETIRVSIEKEPERTIRIEVRILHETDYDVDGHRKAFIDFTLYDLRYKMDRYGQQIDGNTRYFSLMKYTRERLAKLGKNSISELPHKEQEIIAKKLQAAQDGNPVEAD